MIDYGLQKSTHEPEEVEITESMVFVSSDITEVSEEATGEMEEGFVGFEFNLTAYTKDEYIRLQDEKITDNVNELTSTQLALCDVYELLGQEG